MDKSNEVYSQKEVWLNYLKHGIKFACKFLYQKKVIQSEVLQTQKEKYGMYSLLSG